MQARHRSAICTLTSDPRNSRNKQWSFIVTFSATAAFALAAGLLTTQATIAAEPAPNGDASSWTGTAGAGPALVPRYAGGKSMQTWLIPMLSINYKETFYVEMGRVGVNLAASNDKKLALGLAVEPRWGHAASDGPLLAGTRNRKSSLEGGPTVDWESPLADFNLSYFGDISGAGRGRSLRIGASREFKLSERLQLGANLGLDRVNAKTVNYYFGVDTTEATLSRPSYAGKAGTDVTFGFDGGYALDRGHSIVFGANITRLNSSAADSPIVETRQVKWGWIGYAWTL